jgi:predicted CXXCH cytochrome family protein
MGCEECHRASSEKGKTTTAPVVTAGRVCARCHEAEKARVLDMPYRGGPCLICHKLHTTNFLRQMRAETIPLSLSCHGVKQPGGEVNQQVEFWPFSAGLRRGPP